MRNPLARLSSCAAVVATLLVVVPSCIALATPPAVAPDIAQVTIDTGATMSLTPGEGVGVFVQYAKGGHWILSTTCDTRISRKSCAFDVVIAPEAGATLSEVAGQGLSRKDKLELRDDGTVRLVTRTSLGVAGVTFDTEPGAMVEFDVWLDGVPQPRFVYLVSDGSVAEGVPTNPVDVVPSTP